MINFTTLKSNKPKDLRKTYSVVNGEVRKASVANMVSGLAWSETCSDLSGLSSVLDNMKKDECLMTGSFPNAECRVIAGKKNTRAHKNIYSRTLDNVTIPNNSLYVQLLDNDPHEKGVTFNSANELIDYLHELNPVFKDLEVLVRPSSSAGIKHNGKLLKETPSWHAFIKVSSSVTPHQLGKSIEALCWARGDGFIALSKSGAKLERCTFDIAVFSPERLIFEAKPKLSDGLTRKKYESAHQAGRELTIEDLPEYKEAEIELLKATAKAEIDGESVEVSTAFKANKVAEMVESGVALERAVLVVDNLTHAELTLDALVTLSDGTQVTVGFLCENHKEFHGQAMPDPIEGIGYGVTTAKFYWNDGQPFINSFAHGGCKYTVVESCTPPIQEKCITPLSEKLELIDFPDAAMNEAGTIHVPCTIETTYHLMSEYGFDAKYNVISKATEITSPMCGAIVKDNSFDFGVSLLQSQAAKNRLGIGQIPAYVNAISQANHYNPVVDWFTSKPWDGKSRIGELLDCVKVEGGWDEAKKTYMTRWLYGAAGMQLNTGSYSTRGTLVFAGAQNIGKTYFLQILAGEMWQYCLDGLTLNPSDRDSVKKFCSQWLVELGELDATFRKSDISALKAFLTLKKDEMRVAYARGESIFPRRTVAIASVNDRTFLRDSTGNTRYWCLPVNGFDFDKLRDINMQQLWAEIWDEVNFAIELDPINLPWFLNAEESEMLAMRNAEFEEPCEITATLIRYIKPNNGSGGGSLHSANDIVNLLQLPKGQRVSNIVGKVLREKLGYEIATPKSKRCYLVDVPDIANVAVAQQFSN